MIFPTLLGDTPVTASVQIPDVIPFDNEISSGTVYSGVQFNSNGNIARRQPGPGGPWAVVGVWLSVGVNTAFHIHRTVDSGTLTTDGGDDLVLSSNRVYDIQVATGQKEAVVTFRISNVADSITYDTRAYSFSGLVEL